jgi:hypothetical protein
VVLVDVAARTSPRTTAGNGGGWREAAGASASIINAGGGLKLSPGEGMKFLGGLCSFVLGIAIIVALFRSKRPTNMGNHASCLVIAFVVMGAFIMATEAWNWGKFFFSWDNLTNWGPATIYQATVTRIRTSPIQPTTIFYPTRTVAYHPVTWMELVSFISDDHTNWNEYNVNKYNCLDFSIDLVENATKQNIKAWIVSVMFYGEEVGHSFVAFDTTDRGIVFIEPQADVPFVNPTVDEYLVDAWQGNVFIGRISSIEYLQCDNDHSGYCDPYIP